ncbi:porin family protein [Agarivorans aestuarii]|uniref:Porin family protein n=1 Tax=Agarivorans aestuarii TaxID=1563703 RepID=A0ABU7G7E6_9ALTE|nr:MULTISPECIES: porin family protein [Agarivorans]MEE1675312.1 porin family protein [Agarivorans aestuarii]
MNKKTLLASLMVCTMSTGAMAADVDWFAGAGLGYQADNVKGMYNGEDDGATYQLRGGAIINDNHRVMGTYAYMDELSQNSLIASYDYLYPLNDNFSLFIGASMGASDSEINNQSSTEFVWGGQTGVIYNINDNWSAELSYRYLEQDYEEASFKLNDTQQIMLSVDYHF